jgi:hypothetical protein
MARKNGRAPKGERLRANVPHGHWKTTTFVAGLRLSGLTAPMVLDGPINGVWFQAYVDQALVPTLSPGDIVVMDNLCRPTAPTSTRSRRLSRSSRRSCAKLPSAMSTLCGTGSEPCLRSSPQSNAQTSSPPPAMSRFEKKPL